MRSKIIMLFFVIVPALSSYGDVQEQTSPAVGTNREYSEKSTDPIDSLAAASDSFDNKVRYLYSSTFQFRLSDLEGNMVSSNDERFKNKVMLFTIGGTWCSPCNEMTPFLKRLHAEYTVKGLEVVGVAFEKTKKGVKNPKTLVADYVSENKIQYLMLYGGAAQYASTPVFNQLPIFREFDGFPTIVVIARDGTAKLLVDNTFDEETAKRIERLVLELLAAE